jgi:hypothetical protein
VDVAEVLSEIQLYLPLCRRRSGREVTASMRRVRLADGDSDTFEITALLTRKSTMTANESQWNDGC